MSVVWVKITFTVQAIEHQQKSQEINGTENVAGQETVSLGVVEICEGVSRAAELKSWTMATTLCSPERSRNMVICSVRQRNHLKYFQGPK